MLLSIDHKGKQHCLIALICGLVGVEFLENGMFVFAARPILDALHATPESFALVQMAYAVGNILMVATQQWMTRHFGYRRYLLMALLLFAAGAVGCALSVNLPELIIARMLQGMGGGAFFLSTGVLIPLMFSVAARPVASRSFLFTVFAMGAISPLLAASLVVGPGWEWIFWLQLPIVAVLTVGVIALMPSQFGRSTEPVHWSFASILLLLLAFGSIQWALSEANYMMQDHPGRLAIAMVVGMTLLGLFSLHQWRHNEPLLHLRDLTDPTILAGLGMYAVYYFIVNFNNYLFPQYAELGLGLSALTTGWLNSFSGLVTFGAVVAYSFYSAKVTNKRPMMVAGCLCMAVSAFWMTRLPIDASVWALLPPLAIKGLFGVMMILPIASLTWRGLDDAHFAKGYQTKNVMRQMMVSLASAAAAVALQHQRTVEHGKRTGGANSTSPSLDMQSVFLAGQHLYLWVEVLALLAGAIVLAQRKFR